MYKTKIECSQIFSRQQMFRTSYCITMESVRGQRMARRMANGSANRGSLFNVRHPVLYSLRRFLFIFSNVLYSRFAIQCSPRRSPFAAPFAIRLVICYAVRHSPRRFLFIVAIQTSLFNVRRAVRHSQFAIRQSPSHSPFAAPFAVALQCPLTLSIHNNHLIFFWQHDQYVHSIQDLHRYTDIYTKTFCTCYTMYSFIAKIQFIYIITCCCTFCIKYNKICFCDIQRKFISTKPI